MSFSVRVLATSSVDSTPSILLVAPGNSKVLVNCGEGCQRTFIEYSQRLTTVRAVCLTHLGPEAIGGLPGVILTSADQQAASDANDIVAGNKKNQKPKDASGSKKPALDIIGPTNTQKFLHSLRHFMLRENFQIQVHEGARSSVQTCQQSTRNNGKNDCAFTIQALPITVNWDSGVTTRKRPLPGGLPETTTERSDILSFLITTPPVAGKFLVDQAKALGVPAGPLYAKLKSGECVTFTNTQTGEEMTVESAQVLSPQSPPASILILYYPCHDVASILFGSKKIRSATDSKDTILQLVVHIAPKDLYHEFALPYWKESESVEHIFLSTDRLLGDVDGTPYKSAACEATARSLLCKEIYRVPCSAASPFVNTEDDNSNKTTKCYHVGRVMMEYIVNPPAKRGFVQPPISISNQELAHHKEAQERVQETGAFKEAQSILGNLPASPQNFAGEILFAGTGAALPCKQRNVTGMLLRQDDGRSILLDVGEGTIGQLLRMCDGGDDILDSIKVVWVSHPHADHHLGILRLLQERQSLEPIQLIAPTPLFKFLEEYAALFPLIRCSYYAINCKDLVRYNHEIRMQLELSLGISGCRAVPVKHCPNAFAVILEGVNGFGKVVYSGDCRPSRELAQAARGADLLIHEATFEMGMEAEAALKRHSTVAEALQVADDMVCKIVVLTHFSQRYSNIPPMPSDDSLKRRPVIFAFDSMKLQSHTLQCASEMTRAVILLRRDNELEADKVATTDAETAAEAMSVPGTFARSDLL
jgi:ribonuclease Z